MSNVETEVLNSSTKSVVKPGIVLIGVTGGLALALSVGCAPFISPALRRFCLPYVPATSTQIHNIFIALSGRTGRFIDLGSGDGRIVIAAAKLGFKADGVELNPWLTTYSAFQAIRKGVFNQTNFYCSDLWKFNLNSYQNIVIFGVDQMMPELEKKLNSELDSRAVVVACRFPFPTKQPTLTIGKGIDTVWLYKTWKASKKTS